MKVKVEITQGNPLTPSNTASAVVFVDGIPVCRIEGKVTSELGADGGRYPTVALTEIVPQPADDVALAAERPGESHG